MSQEQLIKYHCTIKNSDSINYETNLFGMFTTDVLTKHAKNILDTKLNKASHNKKNQSPKGKLEMITAIRDNKGVLSFKKYLIDTKSDTLNVSECLVNISAKTDKQKGLTYEDKVNYLKAWMKQHNKKPQPKDKYKELDVGAFYKTCIESKAKGEKVEQIVSSYLGNKNKLSYEEDEEYNDEESYEE